MPDFKKMMDSPYLGHWDVADLPGGELILTIKRVRAGEIVREGGAKDKRPIIDFNEPNTKPMVCNATNAKTISKLAGSRDTDRWANVRIILFVDKAMRGGSMEPCLRIRDYAPKDSKPQPSQPTQPKEPPKCEDCGNEVTDYTAPTGTHFTAEQMASTSRAKFGRVRCLDCIKTDKTADEKPADDNEGGATNEADTKADS